MAGREKETIDRWTDKNVEEKQKRVKHSEFRRTLCRRAGIPKGRNSDTHSGGEDEDAARGVCIMWAELNVSPGGFRAGRHRDINQT